MSEVEKYPNHDSGENTHSIELQGIASQVQYFLSKQDAVQQTLQSLLDTDYGKKVLSDGVSTIHSYPEFAGKIPVLRQALLKSDSGQVVRAEAGQTFYEVESGGTSGNPKEFYWPQDELTANLTPQVMEEFSNAESPAVLHGNWRSSDFDVIDETFSKKFPNIDICEYSDVQDAAEKIKNKDVIFFEVSVSSLATFIYYLEEVSKQDPSILESFKGKKFFIEPSAEPVNFADMKYWYSLFYEITGVEPAISVHYSQNDTGLIGLYVFDPNHERADYKYKIEKDRFVETVNPESKEPVIGERGEILITTLRDRGSIMMRYESGDEGIISYDENNNAYLSEIKRKSEQGMFSVMGEKMYVPEIAEVVSRNVNQTAQVAVDYIKTQNSKDHIINLDVFIPRLLTPDDEASAREYAARIKQDLLDSDPLLCELSKSDDDSVHLSLNVRVHFKPADFHKQWKLTKSIIEN